MLLPTLRPLLRVLISILMMAYVTGETMAQTLGAPKSIPLNEKAHKAKEEMTERFPFLCAGDRVYFFEHAREGLSPIYKYFGYAYDRNSGTVLAVRNLGLPEEKNIKPVEAFFMAGDKPAYVERTWDAKAGKVGLRAQLLDPVSLEPDGPPVKVGDIPLESYLHTLSLGIDVMPSPDGSKLLFCFDRVQSGGMQVAMLWVTDAQLEPVWNGVYKVPTQALGYQRELLFDDNGAAYFEVNAILLETDDVKVRSDGSQKVKVKGNYINKRSHTWFRMRDKEYSMWDGTLPDGRVVGNMSMALVNDRLVIGGFIEEDGVCDWVRVTLDEAFSPTDLHSGHVVRPKTKGLEVLKLVPGENGETYLYGHVEYRNTLIVLIDGAGKASWETSIEGPSLWSTGFSKDGTLYIPQSGAEESVAKLMGAGEWKAPGMKLHPVLISVDRAGKVHAQDLIPASMSGTYPSWTGFDRMAACNGYATIGRLDDATGIISVVFE